MFGSPINNFTNSCINMFIEKVKQIDEKILIESDLEQMLLDICHSNNFLLEENIIVDFENPYCKDGEIEHGNDSTSYTIYIPVIGTIKNLKYKPCGHYLNCYNYDASINEKENVLSTTLTISTNSISSAEIVDKAIENKILRIKGNITTQLGYLLPEIKSHNAIVLNTCRKNLDKHVESIMARINAASVSNESKYLKIIPKTIVPIEIVEKKIETQSIPKSKESAMEHTKSLLNSSYIGIIDSLIEYSRYVERLPKSYSQLDEEGIRDQIINALNLKLQTATASGETFNYKGKTDIIIIDNKLIYYIAECKIWKGIEAFKEAIIQLLGYVSSEVFYTSIIIFNKNKQNIQDKVNEVIFSNDSYKKILKNDRYIFKHPTNENNELEISIVYFNIGQP